jgi:hypothetical protein
MRIALLCTLQPDRALTIRVAVLSAKACHKGAVTGSVARKKDQNDEI